MHLMRKLLDAGYLEEWQHHRTLSGVPQGSIVSPVLSNIYLDKLDKFVETVLIPHYTSGEKRKPNLEYAKMISRSQRLRKAGKRGAAQALKRQAQQLPSMEPNDPDFRRLRYVRYADDFCLSFIGPKSEAEEIKQRIKEFLQEQLKLELSEAKTLITHARSQAAHFLGYELTSYQVDTKQSFRTTGKVKSKGRSINGRIGLRIPRDVIEQKSKRYRNERTVKHRMELVNESDYTLLMTYQLEYRGLVNYYRLAYNLHTFHQLKWAMETSLTKTLARKYQVSVKTIYERYHAEVVVNGTPYRGLRVTVPEKERSLSSQHGVAFH